VSLQLVRVVGDLPDGFAALRAAAEAEGHRHMTRLADEWMTDPATFVPLMAAVLDADLVGIGGLTREPQATAPAALRMRRLYLSARARREGVGRTIANALLQEAFDQVTMVTVHAGNNGAAAFWEVMGFAAIQDRPWSHELRRLQAAPIDGTR
jgi:GNAT superfamily N-acetyltransferase